MQEMCSTRRARLLPYSPAFCQHPGMLPMESDELDYDYGRGIQAYSLYGPNSVPRSSSATFWSNAADLRSILFHSTDHSDAEASSTTTPQQKTFSQLTQPVSVCLWPTFLTASCLVAHIQTEQRQFLSLFPSCPCHDLPSRTNSPGQNGCQTKKRARQRGPTHPCTPLLQVCNRRKWH
jgi:hypothetical protein